MKYFKKIKFLLPFVIFILIFTLFLSLINFIIPQSINLNKILILICFNLYLLIYNINVGKTLENNAYLNGLKVSGITILILYLIGSLLTSFKISIARLIYYLIISLSIILGNVIGINKKKS